MYIKKIYKEIKMLSKKGKNSDMLSNSDWDDDEDDNNAAETLERKHNNVEFDVLNISNETYEKKNENEQLIDDLQKENDILRINLLLTRQNNENLLQHLDTYEQKISKERQQNSSLIIEKDDQNIRIGKLVKRINQCDLLHQQYQELRSEYTILSSKYNTLKNYNR